MKTIWGFTAIAVRGLAQAKQLRQFLNLSRPGYIQDIVFSNKWVRGMIGMG